MHLKRINGSFYAYESIRNGRKVTSRSAGPVPPDLVPIHRMMNGDRRRDAEAAREDEREAARIAAEGRARRRAMEAAGAEFREYDRRVWGAVERALGAAGYRRHDRGAWRRRRGMAGTTLQRSEVRELVALAREGDRIALAQLSGRAPWLLRDAVCEGAGNLDESAEDALTSSLRTSDAGADRIHRQAIEARMEEIRRDLAPPFDSTPIEQALATRAALNWLHVALVEQEFLHVWNAQKFDPKTAAHLQRLLSAATSRYERSLVSLARVKRLSVPVLIGQVNVAMGGGNQVNQAQVNS